MHYECLSVIKKTGYHTSDNRSEQIDGVVNIDGTIFLLEAKWSKTLAASDLYEFIGKVENKFFGTLGIFVSYTELSKNFINSLNKGRKQNVIVLHDKDVQALFLQDVNIKNYLKYVIERLSFDNVSHIPVKEFMDFTKQGLQLEVIQTPNDRARDFITNFILPNVAKTESEIEIALNKLEADVIAIIYKYLLEKADKVLKFTLDFQNRYFNSRTFFLLVKPNHSHPEYKRLASNYFTNYIFAKPEIYLFYLLNDFIDMLDVLEEGDKKKFFTRFSSLFKQVDYYGENLLTEFVKHNWKKIPKEVLIDVQQFYIEYYYSSREARFAQKAFAM